MYYRLLYIVTVAFSLSLFLVQKPFSKNQTLDLKTNLEIKENLDMSNLKKAYFAGGCFWCMQPPFDSTDGVEHTSVGYSGGSTENPTYSTVSTGATNHAEAIEVIYDPAKVKYDKLVDVFLRNINPTQEGGQFADIGAHYRTEIFYNDDEEKRIADSAVVDISKKGPFAGKDIAVKVSPFSSFFDGEEYHQKYYLKNYDHYNRYKVGSGRAGFIDTYWKPYISEK
jgi:peptide methionine sulfoxide reductase msrA/msrB